MSGAVNWDRTEEEIALFRLFDEAPPGVAHARTQDQLYRASAARKYFEGDFASALASWNAQKAAPRGPVELAIVADSLAAAGDEKSIEYIEQLRAFQPIEAHVILARLRLRQGKSTEAANALIAAFSGFQQEPWPMRLLMKRSLPLAAQVARANKLVAKELFAAARKPFSVYAQDELRRQTLVELARQSGDRELLLEAIGNFEPHVPWTPQYLADRLETYMNARHPLQLRASEELIEFRKAHADDPLVDLITKRQPADPAKATAAIEK